MFARIVAALALLGSVQAFTYTVSQLVPSGEDIPLSSFQVTVGIDETDGQQGIGFDPSAIRPVGTLTNEVHRFRF